MEQYNTAMVTKSQAAKILGVSIDTLRRMINSNKIKADGTYISLWTVARFLVS